MSKKRVRLFETLEEFQLKRFRTTSLNAAILLTNTYMAAKDPNIGWEDARQHLNMFTKEMRFGVTLLQGNIERALWACNMLEEQGKFWHPRDLTFHSFLDIMLDRRWNFDKTYNLLTKREKKE